METTARAKVRVNLTGALDVSKPWSALTCFALNLLFGRLGKYWAVTFLESEDNEQHQGKYWKLSIMGIMVMMYTGVYFDSGDRRQAEDLFWL